MSAYWQHASGGWQTARPNRIAVDGGLQHNPSDATLAALGWTLVEGEPPQPPPPPIDDRIRFIAHVFRTTLERHFGAGAATNHAVTSDAVEGHFEALRQGGSITAQDVADGVTLSRLWDVLRTFNGTDETWTLFERLEAEDDA